MLPNNVQAREARLRRLARKADLVLVKSRCRTPPDALDYGGFMLVEIYSNCAVLGAHPFAFSADLDDVRSYLEDD